MIVPRLTPRLNPAELDEFIDRTFIRLFGMGPPLEIYVSGQPYRLVHRKEETDESYFGGFLRISDATYQRVR